MGLIRALAGATGGVLADQWKEFFYCEALPADVLVTKGEKNLGVVLLIQKEKIILSQMVQP